MASSASVPEQTWGVSGLCGDGECTEPAPTNGDRQGERHEYHSGQRPSNRGQRYGGSSVKQKPGRERDEKDGSVRGPVCFSCGKRGHKKFDCPNKIARVTSSGGIVSRVIGQVGSTECAMTIDSGALLTMVRADLVKQVEYSGEMLKLKSVCGKTFTARAACVWLHFREYCLKHTVAVSEEMSEAVLLGMDLDLLNYLLQLEEQQRSQGLPINTITRAQAKKQAKQNRRDEELNAQDEAQPVSIDADDSVERDSMNEVVAQDVNRDRAVVQGQENERDTLEEVEDSARGVDSVEEKNEIMDDVQIVNVEGEQEEEDWPVPELSGDEEKALIEQQKDKTLESVRKWANAGEKGFGVQDGIIVHKFECEHGEVWRCVVVPKERSKDILRLSHSSLTGGHFSAKR